MFQIGAKSLGCREKANAMRLNLNEIRVRSASFAKDWEYAHYEKRETQRFYNDFFEVFGVKRRRIKISIDS